MYRGELVPLVDQRVAVSLNEHARQAEQQLDGRIASMLAEYTATTQQRLGPAVGENTGRATNALQTIAALVNKFGELAEALAKQARGDGKQENLAEEFADVMAWLATLANITDVDLTQAIHDKYISDGGPEGTK